MAGFSFENTAKALQVTERTVRNWEAGRAKIPYAAFKLLKILSGFALPDPAWRRWTFRNDTLWSPDGKAFPVHTLGHLSPVFAKARLWDEKQRQRRPLPLVPPDPVQLELPGVPRIWKTTPSMVIDPQQFGHHADSDGQNTTANQKWGCPSCPFEAPRRSSNPATCRVFCFIHMGYHATSYQLQFLPTKPIINVAA